MKQSKEIAGILLAAGSSSRFGSNKLLQPLANNKTLAVSAAINLKNTVANVIAVVRPKDSELIDAFSQLNLKVVVNERADEGMSSSLISGIQASGQSAGWIIALADMPWVKPETINTLKEQLLNGETMVAPVYQGRRGNPVGFSAKWKNTLLELEGDKGARDLLINHSEELYTFDTDDQGVAMDVDFPADINNQK